MKNAVPSSVSQCLLLFLALGCGHGEESGDTAQAVSEGAASGKTAPATSMDGLPLFLIAPDQTVSETGELWIPFRLGATLPGVPVLELGASFDPLFFRIGGEQWSLSPEQEVENTGAFGLLLRLDPKQRGDAMLGFSTRPRTIATKSAAVTLRIQRHVKLLFHVGLNGKDLPSDSAAVTARFGLKMEFVPLIDPLPLEIGAELPLRLRFDGPGLASVLVHVQFLAQGEGQEGVHVHSRYSDPDGHFVLPIHAAGIWRLTAMHQVRGSGGIIERHVAEIVFRTGEK